MTLKGHFSICDEGYWKYKNNNVFYRFGSKFLKRDWNSSVAKIESEDECRVQTGT